MPDFTLFFSSSAFISSITLSRAPSTLLLFSSSVFLTFVRSAVSEATSILRFERSIERFLISSVSSPIFVSVLLRSPKSLSICSFLSAFNSSSLAIFCFARVIFPLDSSIAAKSARYSSPLLALISASREEISFFKFSIFSSTVFRSSPSFASFAS